MLDIRTDISKITSDGDPTKNHVTNLLEILPGRRDISVSISRSGASYVSKRYYYVILLIKLKNIFEVIISKFDTFCWKRFCTYQIQK